MKPQNVASAGTPAERLDTLESPATFDVRIRDRFNRPEVASEYARRKNHRHTWKNRRELKCIQAALRDVPAEATVLDLPAGTGRLLPMLQAMGYRVIAGDYSPHMLEEARAFCAERGQASMEPARFAVLDAMQIDLPDKSVDVTICNRLFHHFPTSELRQRALKELARVTRHNIIISYFSNVSLSALRFHIRHRLSDPQTLDRKPIWPARIRNDAIAAGLAVERTFPVSLGLSPQTYLLLRHI